MKRETTIVGNWLVSIFVEPELVTFVAAPHPAGRKTTDADYEALGLLLADAANASRCTDAQPTHLTKYDSTDAPQRFCWAYDSTRRQRDAWAPSAERPRN